MTRRRFGSRVRSVSFTERGGVVRRRLQPLTWTLLTIVWVMLWGNVSWINVISGAVLSALLLMLFPMPPVRFGIRVRPWATVVLFARFFLDMIAASVEVAYKACVPWERPAGQFVRVPLRGNNDLLCTLTAQMTSLVPGSIVIDIESDKAERTMLLHMFDVPEPADVERLRRRVQDQEDRVLKALSARPYRPRQEQPATLRHDSTQRPTDDGTAGDGHG